MKPDELVNPFQRLLSVTDQPDPLRQAWTGRQRARHREPEARLESNQLGVSGLRREAVRGTQVITRVDVIRNGQVVFSESPLNHEFVAKWSDHEPSGRATDYYYVVVRQSDGERAWSSPLWISGD